MREFPLKGRVLRVLPDGADAHGEETRGADAHGKETRGADAHGEEARGKGAPTEAPTGTASVVIGHRGDGVVMQFGAVVFRGIASFIQRQPMCSAMV